MTGWLLLHGAPLTPAVWNGVIPLLAEHGEVAAPAVVPGPGPATGAHRTLAQRLTTSGIDAPPPWHVVGHSFGGQVALEMALQRPELVASLALLCTRDTPYPPFAALAADVMGGVVDVAGSLQRWFNPTELAADGPVVRYARDALGAADGTAWARALSAISVFDVSATVRAITCPVTVVGANDDRVSDPQAVAEMAGRLPHSELVALKDAGHMSVFTDPVRLVELISAGTRP